MTWKVEFDPRAFLELEKLDKKAQVRIIKFITTRIKPSANPRIMGAPLKGKLGNLWKYRIGDYRLVCRIEDKQFLVLVIHVGHRKDIYKRITK